jgi:hypothetical protein
VYLPFVLALGLMPSVKHVVPTPPQVHFVVSLLKVRSIFIAPVGAKIPAPLIDAGPVPGAIVTYPDGTTQTADANGIFTPAAAKYALSNDAVLELNPDAQPAVKVQDPHGSALAVSSTVAAFADASSGTPLAGLRTLPAGTEVFSGASVLLSAEATDTSDHAASLGGLTVTWTSSAGKIVPIPGTATALYTAPNVSVPLLDMVRAVVTAPGADVSLSSSSAIETLPPSSGFTFFGTITAAGGAPVGGATALFTAQGTSRVFGSYNFFARADAAGAYSALVPAGVNLLGSVGTNAAASPNGVADFFLTDNELEAGDPGGSAMTNLSLRDTGEFDDGKEDASRAIAPPIASVRDAWFGTEFTTPGPWAADSGLLALLAAPPKTLPSPAVPATLHGGLFTNWCYQWTLRAGVPSLALVENGAASCVAPGTVAYAISRVAGGVTFARYAAASGRYALRAPLDPTLGGAARLIAAGTWTQSVTGPPGAPVTDVALVRVDDYGPAAPRFGSPHSTERFRYTYAASAAGARAAIDQDALVDVASGRTVQTATAQLQQAAALDAAGCFGAAQPRPCYTMSADVERYAYTSAGTVSSPYRAMGSFYGDGSEARQFVARREHERSRVVLPVGSLAQRAARNCTICAPAVGALLDGDGITQLATVTSADDAAGTLTLLDTQQDGPPGGPVVLMRFAL